MRRTGWTFLLITSLALGACTTGTEGDDLGGDPFVGPPAGNTDVDAGMPTETPDGEPDPDPDPNPQPNPDPNPDPNPQPNPDPNPDPNPQPNPQPDPQPEPQPEPEPDPQPNPQPNPQPDPQPQPQPQPDPQPPPQPQPSTNPTYPTAHPRIYMSAHKARLQQQLAANGPAATRFKTIVDQYVGGSNIWGFRAWNAALMGQLTNDPRYCTKAVSVIEAQVTAAESAIASGQRPAVASDSYLEVGDLIGDLALVYDWCHGNLSASQKTRWLAYANQAVWNVWNHTQAKWGNTTFAWTGWSVNDPSDNYYYSFLRATMLLGLAAHGESAQATGWLTQFRDTKVLGQLVPTFNADLTGGGSREGTGYGVAMRNLWKLYDLWKATTGEDLSAKTPHTRASMLAFMHQAMPTFDRVAPTGDLSRDSTAAWFDYHRDYLQTLIALHPSDALSKRAKKLLETSSLTRMGQQFMIADDFLYDQPAVTSAPIDLNTTYHASGIGQLYARSSWTDKSATWVNLTAGPYTQSHAHQDQGSLMIYKDGWLGHDAVINSRSGLVQQTTAHSLVRIDSGGQPVRQIANTQSRLVGLTKTASFVHAAADLTPAYNGNSAVSKVQREIVFLPPNVVVVYDRVASASGTTQTWQLAAPVSPSISGNKATIANAGHTLTVQRLAPSATPSVKSMADSEYTGGYRLDETMPGGDQRYLHVLSIDGAATNVMSANDSSVSLTVNGQQATISFNRNAVGGTLTLGGATTQLGATVQQLAQ